MQHRGPLRTRLPLATLVAGVLLTGGCSTTHVDAYPVRSDSAVDCRALLHDLPQELAGRDRVLVDDDVAGSWGDPPVVLRCGVRSPEPTTTCADVGDQGWRGAGSADGTSWRSLGRSLQVTVDVPGSTEPVVTRSVRRVLVDVAAVVDDHSRGAPLLCP